MTLQELLEWLLIISILLVFILIHIICLPWIIVHAIYYDSMVKAKLKSSEASRKKEVAIEDNAKELYQNVQINSETSLKEWFLLEEGEKDIWKLKVAYNCL